MRKKAGFTVVELIIMLVITTILLTLSVVSLRGSQATARDEERKTDVTAIAQSLETFRLGNNYHCFDDWLCYEEGAYPPTTYLNSEDRIKITLRDINPKMLRAPGIPDSSPVSLAIASDMNELSSLNENVYLYQPYITGGELCDDVDERNNCRGFNLYYKLEKSSEIQKITSKYR